MQARSFFRTIGCLIYLGLAMLMVSSVLLCADRDARADPLALSRALLRHCRRHAAPIGRDSLVWLPSQATIARNHCKRPYKCRTYSTNAHNPEVLSCQIPIRAQPYRSLGEVLVWLRGGVGLGSLGAVGFWFVKIVLPSKKINGSTCSNPSHP